MNIATRENGRESKIRERVEIRNLPLPFAFHLTRRWRFLRKALVFCSLYYPWGKFRSYLNERARVKGREGLYSFSPLLCMRVLKIPPFALKTRQQRFLKFPDFSLINVKFPWPTELTISQIMLPSQLSLPPIYLCFQQVKCGVHAFIVPSQ